MYLHHTLRRSGFALAIGATLLAACSDAAEQSPVAPVPQGASQTASAISEADALKELTRLVALALQDAGLRHRIRNDLRESRHTVEHKVAFSEYLHGQSGGILLAKMVNQSGKSRAEVLSLLAAVRPLEFYMPVREHRASWTGGDNLLVASLLEDGTDAPTGYNLHGGSVTLLSEEAPSTPVLALVPVETDFTKPLPAGRYKNTRDNGGNSIGTLAEEEICPMGTDGGASVQCGGGGGDYEIGDGGGGSTTTKPGGLYMTYSYIKSDGEAWLKGDPEIEIHIHGPNGGDKTYGADLACAGDRQLDPYRNFNQDKGTWSGEVLLFDQSQLTDYYRKYGDQGFNVMMWEDDDTACTIKTDKDITQALALIAGAIGAAAVVIAEPTSGTAWTKAVGMFVAAAYASASWLKSNDDFLGAAPQATANSTRTDLWLDPNSTNGYIETSLRYMK